VVEGPALHQVNFKQQVHQEPAAVAVAVFAALFQHQRF
jgi:hypothetical protein